MSLVFILVLDIAPNLNIYEDICHAQPSSEHFSSYAKYSLYPRLRSAGPFLVYYNSLGVLYTSIATKVYLCVNFSPDFTVDKQHSYYNSLAVLYNSIAEQVY